MALQPMRIDGPAATGRPLSRVEIAANGELSERTLQDVLFRNPALLAFNSIGVAGDRLIPVAQAFQTASGRIDNLYVDAAGRLTIVETKLLKNPEAHRSVVAQIVGYPADLATWDYDKLNREVAEQRRVPFVDLDADGLRATLEATLATADDLKSRSTAS